MVGPKVDVSDPTRLRQLMHVRLKSLADIAKTIDGRISIPLNESTLLQLAQAAIFYGYF